MAQVVQPLAQVTPIAGIGPDFFQAPVFGLQRLEHERGPASVLDIGGVDADFQHQTQRIHQNMAFSALYFLGRVVAAGPPFSVVFTL